MARFTNRKYQQTAVLCMAAFFFGLFVIQTNAQNPGLIPKKKSTSRKRIKADGIIHSFNQQRFNVLIKDKPWSFRFSTALRVEVNGPVEASALPPGTLVRLYAYLDDRNRGVKPVTEMTAIEMNEDFQPELSEEAEAEPEKKEGETTAADKTVADKEDSAEESEEEEEEPADKPLASKRRRRSGRKSTAEAKRYFVNGVLKSNRRGKITIAIDRKTTVRIELADDAKVTFYSKSLAAARPGDKVHLTAYFYEQGTGIVSAIEVTRNALPPANDKKSKKKRRSQAKARKRRSKSNEEAKPVEAN